MEALPPSFRPSLLTVVKDYINRAVRGELHLPPWWLRDVGGSDFRATGEEFLRLFVQIGGLQPDERVLEIGCGSGRMAIPLTSYLSRAGLYVGMDITRPTVLWCQRHISRRYPNFHFLHVDLYNKRYNPTGRYLAREYPFPFRDQSFSFIFLTSVFTHLLPEDTAHYLREIARMLRRDGRAFFTFFLLNDEQRRLAKRGCNDIRFEYGPGFYRVRDPAVPESAVAYDEVYLLDLLSECGLVLRQPVYYGSWSGRDDGVSYQDIIIVQHRE